MSTEETKVKKAPEKRVGFDAQGKPYPGVDKSGERMSVSLDGLKKEFGPKKGEEKYLAIALIEGEMTHPGTGEKYMGRYFFDPRTEGPGYRPDLVIATLPEGARQQVADILSDKETT